MNKLNVDAYRLGQESAKSFLLAGERYLQSNISLAGTDEERFKGFFSSLPSYKQKSLKTYFSKQAALSLPERKKVLGKYANLSSNTKLVLSTSAKFIQEVGSSENKLEEFDKAIKNVTLSFPKPLVIFPMITPMYNEISLYLNRLSVVDDEDNNGDDEITLNIIQTDVTGQVSFISKKLGSVKKFRNQNDIVKNVKLASVSFDDGGDVFPKAVHFTIIGIERDSGSKKWNDLMSKLIKVAQDKVNEELIAKGLVQGGLLVGVPIPPEVALIVASFVEGYVDNFIAQLGGLLKDYDDIMEEEYSINYQIEGFDYTKQSNDDIKKSPIVSFKKGGLFKTEGHWLADFYIKKEGRGASQVVTPSATNARLEWWEEKDFRGRKHTKYLNPMQNGKCIKLVHNDKMKSMKFYANAGASLRIYDDGKCRSDDDVGIASIPIGKNMVAVPKIGRRGEREAVPTGSYKLYFKNGIVGKVTTIMHTSVI